MRARGLIGALLGALVFAGGAGAAAWTDSSATNGSDFEAAAAFPPIVDKVPEVLGVSQVGGALLGTNGAFTPDPTSRQVAWLKCDATGASCAPAGVTIVDALLTAGDGGATFRVQVTPINNGVAGPAVRSEPSLVVSVLSLTGLSTPLLSTTPTVGAATPTVGVQMTAARGTWNGLITNYAYAWERCDAVGSACAAIPGATAQTYTPVAADRGNRLRVKVSASTAGLLPGSAYSPASAKVL